MIRDGAFKATDVVLAWHPDDQNRVTNRTRLAAAATEVEFFGKSSHASASPWAGRSALDALMLFDHAMALMREHIKPTARIHRVVKEGGAAANIIPDHTMGEYWVRDATGESVQELLARLRKAADGAAMATETRAQVKLTFSVRDVVPNGSLDAVLQKELERIGPPSYDAQDQAFARALQKELGLEQSGMTEKVQPYAVKNGGTASSDIGEVSAVVPLSELNIATRPLGTVAHHWAQTSCAAHPVGFKGMLVAAKVLAASAWISSPILPPWRPRRPTSRRPPPASRTSRRCRPTRSRRRVADLQEPGGDAADTGGTGFGGASSGSGVLSVDDAVRNRCITASASAPVSG
jgi:aminobenzoyl-glutamate utilization protein B